MRTIKRYPTQLMPKDLDRYLAHGWYRMVQSIFTCHFLYNGKDMYSVFWTRLPLEGYSFRKSLRKVLVRNEKRFTTVVRPVEITDEKEELFTIYARNFDGNLYPTLHASLYGNHDRNIYNTYETCVYDGDKLIAFSFFDVGSNSLQSVKGVYDPDYAQHSLGLYTMLLEIKWGVENDMTYFYPGYIVPGNPRFDYKLKMGTALEVEYWQPQLEQWLSYTEFGQEEIPAFVIKEKLNELVTFSDQYDLSGQGWLYPAFESSMLGYWIWEYLDHPYIVRFPAYNDQGDYPTVVYDFTEKVYLTYVTKYYADLSYIYMLEFEETDKKWPMLSDILLRSKLLKKSDDLFAVCEHLMLFYKYR